MEDAKLLERLGCFVLVLEKIPDSMCRRHNSPLCLSRVRIFLPDIQNADRAIDFPKIANKEVEWDFSDAEEAAIYDMIKREKSFMFGVKNT